MSIINQGNWAQVAVSTNAVGIRTAASILRRLGYRVKTFSMGMQVTEHGLLKMTMIDVRRGEKNEDTFEVTDILKCHIPELRN